MNEDYVRVQQLTPEQANGLAKQFGPELPNRLTTVNGVAVKPATVFGWSTWANVAHTSEAFAILVGETPAFVMWLEPDAFNSDCLHVAQARLYWLFNPLQTFTANNLRALSAALCRILNNTESDLVTLRLFGHGSNAIELFQGAGFRLVIGNAWLYRWPIKPLRPAKRPKGVSFEIRDLKQSPLRGHAVDEYLQVAVESFFADRFSFDLNIDQALVRERFLAIVKNGLGGEIADYAVTARSQNRGVEAFAFFGVTRSLEANAYPQAGKWLTLIARRSIRAQGIAHSVIAGAIRLLPEGKANWTCTCALDNLGSLQTAQRLGFRIGAIVYDLHRWRESPIS